MFLSISDKTHTTIGSLLPFEKLAMLYSTSKKLKKVLHTDFTKRSHPAIIDYLGNRIMEEREIEPCEPYSMRIVDSQTLKFEHLDENNIHRLTYFCTALSEDEKSLLVKASYIFPEDGVNMPYAMIDVTITPSEINPAKEGTVTIKKQCSTDSITESEYNDGLDPRLVIEWCPVGMPEIMD